MRFTSLLTVACLVFAFACVAQENKEGGKDVPLSVMTFNLRFASDRKPNAWPDRRPVMAELIRNADPDVIGTQEGVYPQLRDLASDLPAYDWIGLGREGGSRGEFMAVYFKKDRFEPLEYDHFWLSDTPMVMGSKGWGNNITRMVTWVRFRERQSGRQFIFVNTHFDHQSQPAREKSAELLRKRIEAMDPKLPLICLGDFNAAAKNNKAYDVLTGGSFMADTWESAATRKGEDVGTFHNYKGATTGGARIDWILTRGPIATDAVEVITFEKGGQYPSDHFPVAAWLRLTAE